MKQLYAHKHTGDATVDWNFRNIELALTRIAAAIGQATFYSTVTVGLNGVGYIQLPPVRRSDQFMLAQAILGARVIVACRLSAPIADAQTSFEHVLTRDNQIKQISSANLTAVTFLFVVAN